MIKLSLILSLIFLNVLGHSQPHQVEFLSLLDNLNIHYQEKETGIYKINYRDNSARFFDLNPFVSNINNISLTDSTIIDLSMIDTSIYSHLYLYNQSVIGLYNGESDPGIPLMGDVNQNGRNEFYGFDYGDVIPAEYFETLVFELDEYGIFRIIKKYPLNTTTARNIFDVDRDGSKELHLLTIIIDTSVIHKQSFYKKPSEDSLATVLDFEYVPYYNENSQLNDFTFGDFDSDTITDCAYISFPPGTGHFIVGEYNNYDNQIDSVFGYVLDDYTAGFTIGDLDLDNKQEIIMSDINGIVYLLEAESDNEYLLTWEGNVNTLNAYWHMKTDDIDKNLKPEFWVGGQFFPNNGPPIVRLTCFETVGDNEYKQVHRIDLVGIFSFFAYNLQAVDIDKDGTEELFICIGNYIIILKFVGKPIQHKYSIYYCKIGETRVENPIFKAAGCMDIFSEDIKDIIISMSGSVNGEREDISFIYKYDKVNSVPFYDEHRIEEEIKLYQNFPNPFNNQTSLKLFVPNSSQQIKYRIVIYNILGEIVNELFESDLSQGEYSINWEGKDNYGDVLPSGTYFISLEGDNKREIIKAIILK
jgi:hypothetical protein